MISIRGVSLAFLFTLILCGSALARPTLSASLASVGPDGTETVKVSGGPGDTEDWVGLYAVGAANTAYISWQFLNGSTSPPATGKKSATLTFVMPATAGQYQFRFFPNNEYSPVLATSNTVTVTAPPTLTAAPATVSPGGTETVKVSGGPGNTTDWVGLYPVGAANNTNGYSGQPWEYLSGTQSPPSPAKTSATLTFTIPSTATSGQQYNFRFFADNGWTLLATSGTVTVGAGPCRLTRRTQKPFSELWNVTRSTSPARPRLACLICWAAPSLHDEQEDLEMLRRSSAPTCLSGRLNVSDVGSWKR